MQFDPSLRLPPRQTQQPPPLRQPPSIPTSYVKNNIQTRFPNFSNFISRLPSFPGLNKLFSGLSTKIGGLGLQRMFKSGVSSLTKSAAIKMGLGAATGGIATAVSVGLDLIKSITGIDIEGMLIKGAVFIVVALAAIIFVLPHLFPSPEAEFSSLVGEYAISVPLGNIQVNQPLTWNEFEKKYLLPSTKNTETAQK